MEESNRGILLYANNNSKCNYVKQAYALALSIKIKNANEKVALLTSGDVEHDSVFDHIIKVPVNSNISHLHAESRANMYQLSPFNETIVMDVDMLVTHGLEQYWNYLKRYSLFFTTNVKTFRGENINDTVYRKTFIENNLPNVYNAFYYFKKDRIAYDFFNLQQTILADWKEYYRKFAPKRTQKWPSMDVTSAMALKIMGIEDQTTDKKDDTITFVHLKTRIQNFLKSPNSIAEMFNQTIDLKGNVFIGNFRQANIVHYVEDNLLTDKNIKVLEELYA